MRTRASLLVLALATAILPGACAETPPYVYKEGEFDRSSEYFNKEPEDIDEVIVCYDKDDTTPQAVRRLAVERCAKYDKTAHYSHQSRLECSFDTPVAAHFDCLGANEPQRWGRPGTPEKPGGTGQGVYPWSYKVPDSFYRPPERP